MVSACLVLSLALLVLGCSGDNPKTTKPTPPGPSGTLVSYTGCKQFPPAALASGTIQDQDCLVYRYDGQGVLELDHINAGFNCCPGSITAVITIEDNVITITESEEGAYCDCNCLFDVGYEITELDPGEYTIHVIEPYVGPEHDPLECTIDLTTSTEGSCCVTRTHYPWGLEGGGEPAGRLIGYDGCKRATYESGPEDYADIDCLEYEYVNNNVLLITHINAGFNCCPGEITADITIDGNVISIVEHEEEQGCKCLCLFDVEYEISDIEPGTWTIRVVELYLDEGDAPLTFTTDLTVQPFFRYCVYRGHYPWQEGGSDAEDHARLDRLKLEIDQIIGTPSCSGDGECRSIAFGDKPCGGPWMYLVYSTSTTDVGVLVREVCAYNALNRVLNGRHGWCSDCMFVGEPQIGCRNGVCVNLDLAH